MNASDRRIMFLSSQAINLVRSDDEEARGSLSKWLEGIELHDIDIILLLICFANHLRLCVAYTQQHHVVLLDPYNTMGARERSRNRSRFAFKTWKDLKSSAADTK